MFMVYVARRTFSAEIYDHLIKSNISALICVNACSTGWSRLVMSAKGSMICSAGQNWSKSHAHQLKKTSLLRKSIDTSDS